MKRRGVFQYPPFPILTGPRTSFVSSTEYDRITNGLRMDGTPDREPYFIKFIIY